MNNLIENLADKIYEIAKNHEILTPAIVSVVTALVMYFVLGRVKL